jgi:competence protein ComEC
MLPATRTRTSFLLIAALGVACPAIAQDTATPTTPAKPITVPGVPLMTKKVDGAAAAPKAADTIDPKAKALHDKCLDTVKKLKGIDMVTEMKFEGMDPAMLPPGIGGTNHVIIDFKPDGGPAPFGRFVLEGMKDGKQTSRFAYNGAGSVMVDDSAKTFTEGGKEWFQLLGQRAANLPQWHIESRMDLAALGAPPEQIPQLVGLSVVGTEKLDGVDCDVIQTVRTLKLDVITLALTPLTLLLFGQVSLVGLLANALAIPWVTLVITPLAMLGVVVGPLWSIAAGAVALLGQVLQWLAELPFAVLSLPQAPLWAGVVGLLGGVLLVAPWPASLRALGLPLLLPVLLWQSPQLPHSEFSVLAADVGQGNAVLVRTRNHALVYDAGPRFSSESDAGHRVLVPLLRALGTKVDTLVLSHRDSDHVGGAAAVLAMQAHAGLLSSLEPNHELQAQRRGRRCEAGQHWQWDGVDFVVLHPQADDYATAPKPNALSCTLRISTGSGSDIRAALLAGDIEQPQEARLVASGVKLDATLLLVPHHGSKTSSSAAFLDAVRPQIALVQTGYRNRFGHPAGPVLARYAERQIELVDSPHCGAATWVSSQPKAVQCHRLEALRYWHHRLP